MYYGTLKEYAKLNRANPTDAEMVLWDNIRMNKIGIPFKRQFIIGRFIADFISLDFNLIIEVDGGYHNLPDQQISDEERTKWLERQGFKVLRFKNEEVLNCMNYVIKRIKDSLD